MLMDRENSQVFLEGRKGPLSSRLVALGCALLVTALLLGGYTVMRRRHAAQQNVSSATPDPKSSFPKGPAKVHVLTDDPMLKAGDTIIGGTVKNVSEGTLENLSVELELRHRKDASVEQRSIPLQAAKLAPNEESRYSFTLPAQEYSSVRLVGIKRNGTELLAFTSGQGLRRPPEKTESKTIVIQRSGTGSHRDEFINTPDNPGRVP